MGGTSTTIHNHMETTVTIIKIATKSGLKYREPFDEEDGSFEAGIDRNGDGDVSTSARDVVPSLSWDGPCKIERLDKIVSAANVVGHPVLPGYVFRVYCNTHSPGQRST